MLIAALMVALVGCSNREVDVDTSTSSDYVEPIVFRVTGYGAFPSEKARLSESQRLLAMRASKLDAYRSLAERVYGTVVVGNSSVRDFVLKDDSFRTMVDSVIRGAKVISVLDNKRGSFETVVELQLEPQFRECLTHVNQFKYNSECSMPLAYSNDSSASVQLKSSSSGQSLYYLK